MGSVKGVSDVSFLVPARDHLRPGPRSVRLRQDHDGRDHRGAGEAQFRRDHPRRHERIQAARHRVPARSAVTFRSCSRTRSRHSIRGCGWRDHRRAARGAAPRQQAGAAEPGLRVARRGRATAERRELERSRHEFSGGQRRRIGLDRALTLNPRLIVADEPVSTLDVSIRAQVLNLMKRLQASHGLTYVVISHDLAVVKYMAERIGVMYLGKLVELGSAKHLRARRAPVHGRPDRRHCRCPSRPRSVPRRAPRSRADCPQPGEPALRVQTPHQVPVRPGALRRRRAQAPLVRPGARGGLSLPAAEPLQHRRRHPGHDQHRRVRPLGSRGVLLP